MSLDFFPDGDPLSLTWRYRAWIEVGIAALLSVSILLLTYSADASPSRHIPVINPKILKVVPHSRHGFTEGLAVCGNHLVESDGLYGHSHLLVRTLPDGRVLHRLTLPNGVFGEGVTCVGPTLIQLTWHRGEAYYYDSALKIIGWQHYAGQGWGLTSHGDQLIASNGTSRLHFYNAQTMHLERTLKVRAGGRRVKNLNELEWVHGFIFANVWMTDRIAIINPRSGNVVDWFNCNRLVNIAGGKHLGRQDVLNGIAYDRTGHCLLVTGKDWPVMFEIAVPKLT